MIGLFASARKQLGIRRQTYNAEVYLLKFLVIVLMWCFNCSCRLEEMPWTSSEILLIFTTDCSYT